METNNTKIIDREFLKTQIERLKNNKNGIKTGLVDLDYQWGGLQPGSTYLIEGNPGIGKTSFMLNLAKNIAVEGRKKVVIFSLNQSKEQLVNKLFAIEAEIDAYNIHRGNIKAEEWNRLIHAAGIIGNGNLLINESMGISVETLENELAQRELADAQVVFIDYLQLVMAEKGYEDKNKELCYISESLKRVANKYNVVIVAMSQLSRVCEEGENKRPVLDDLVEKNSLLAFDQISFIYQDEYNNHGSEMKGIAEIITARSRFDRNGTVRLRWKADCLKFGDLVNL